MTDHLETLKVALDFVNSQPCRCMSIAQLGERDYCDRCSAIRAIKQADSAIALMRGQSEVPYGMVLAPVEPTHEMLAMFWRVCNGADWPKSAGALTKRQLGRAKRAYGLMLAAIPTPPKDTADEQ